VRARGAFVGAMNRSDPELAAPAEIAPRRNPLQRATRWKLSGFFLPLETLEPRNALAKAKISRDLDRRSSANKSSGSGSADSDDR